MIDIIITSYNEPKSTLRAVNAFLSQTIPGKSRIILNNKSSRIIQNCPDSIIGMLATIATILIILWLLGIVTGYTIGWFIHILLVVAIIMFLIRIIQGRNPIE